MPAPASRSSIDPGPDAWGDLEGGEPARILLASRLDTPADVLHALAHDAALTVRAAAAANPAFPTTDPTRLVPDADGVNAGLSQQIAALLPGLPPAMQAAAQARVRRVTMTLAQDVAARLRAALRDTLPIAPEASRETALSLAQDLAITTTGPLVHLLSLLTATDLLAMLVLGRDRRADPAVRCLLDHRSPAVREAAVDALLDTGGPAVRRPIPPPAFFRARLMTALAFLATRHLLDALVCQAGLLPKQAEALRGKFPLVVDDTWTVLDRPKPVAWPSQPSEATLLAAAATGDAGRVAAIVTVASGVASSALARATVLRDAKAMASLAWKAGFSMTAAWTMQVVLAHLSPDETTLPAAGDGFPFSEPEMEWRIAALTGVA